MKKLVLSVIFTGFLVAACSPSSSEKWKISSLTCNLIGESRNMDGVFRIKEVNNARKSIGEPPFLGTDEEIKSAYKNNICELLVLNSPDYKQKLKNIRLADLESRKIKLEALMGSKFLDPKLLNQTYDKLNKEIETARRDLGKD